MRFLTLLALLWSLLSFSVCNAAPVEVTDEVGRLLSDGSLLNKIGEVSSRVEARASQLVVGALGFLGVPYRRGGSDVETGFDCSGFVRAIYQQTAGLLLPRRASEQAASTEKIDKTDLKPGDLVFFNTMRRAFSHVGIYVGNGKFIHAPKPGGEVRVEDLGTSYWAKRFDGARRVLFEAGSPNEPQPQ
jgi:cell wall-associated NlpC family hydrolase